MGPIAFSAQYQQSPIPPGGTIIKRKWLKTYDELRSRPGDRIVMSWDIALSEMETGDYAACVVLLIRERGIFRSRGGTWSLSIRDAEGEGHGAQAEVSTFHSAN